MVLFLVVLEEFLDIIVFCVDRLDKFFVNFFIGELICLVCGCFVICVGLDFVFFCLVCSGDFRFDVVNVLSVGIFFIIFFFFVFYEFFLFFVLLELVLLFFFFLVDFEGIWDLGIEF